MDIDLFPRYGFNIELLFFFASAKNAESRSVAAKALRKVVKPLLRRIGRE